MKLALSSHVAAIDEYAVEKLNLSMTELMHRSGKAVAKAVRDIADAGAKVIIFAGCGNNGGDGYAAATLLMNDYNVTVYDVFSAGQRTDEGKHFLKLYTENGGKLINLEINDELLLEVKESDVIVDAIFGIGFRGDNPDIVKELSVVISSCMNAKKIAVDVPIGINADNGNVSSCAIMVDYTVSISMIKPGIVSYPARSYVGEIIYDSLDLPMKEICKKIDFKYNLTDEAWAKDNLPKREANSNKGSFGKVLLITGSERYRGAAQLSVSAAIRGGAGYTAFYGAESLVDGLIGSYPEVIYYKRKEFNEKEIEKIVDLSEKHKVTLIGSGAENTENMAKTVLSLLALEEGILVLDADAINSLAEIGDEGIRAIRESKRTVILTPHPLEFSRLTGIDVKDIQLHRIETALKFAAENRCIVVLKGAATVITDGENLYINGSGSSALAKAGSGDVLAGFLSSFTASVDLSPLVCAAYSVYLHGKAADNLAAEYSSYGVTPSDLPQEMARVISKIERKSK